MIGKVQITSMGYDPAQGRQVRDPFLGLPSEAVEAIEELVAEIARLRADRAALMTVLDLLLVEIEPFRWAQTEEIDRQVAAKQEWAKHHNATCGNSNEMWFYSTEFRRALEANMEPLLKAIRDGNAVYDRIEAEAKATTSTEG